MDKTLQAKLDRFKTYHQEDTQPMTTKQLCDYAVATATKEFTPVLKELATSLKTERADNMRLRKEIAQLQEELTSSKQAPAKPTFPKSQKLTKMQDELDDMQAECRKLEIVEFSEYRDKTLADIAKRYKKQVAANDYRKAINGSYAQAVEAINEKKREVQASGIPVEFGAGQSVKALFDQEDSSLFTFDTITDTTVYVHGAPFQILERSLSSIGAGNTYRIKLIH